MIAASKSASSKTIFGDLPPSSRETGIIFFAADSYIFWPETSEPVNAILDTCLCSTSGWPTSTPIPVIQFTTPSGNPASDTNFINSKVDAEVNSDGFITAVFPAAKAGASFQDKRSKGEFQAVIIPTTPNGSYLV